LSVVSAVLGLSLAMAGTALAAVPLTTVSTDPYTNTTSFHRTQVEPDTFSFGSTIVSVFQSGRFSSGGSSNIGYATSTNNGATWTNGFLPGTTVFATPPGSFDRISDPSIGFDPEHNVWMAVTLAVNNSGTGVAALASRSTDGGLTFGSPVVIQSLPGGFLDKTWVGCDTWAASPNFGNCYVEYDNAFAGNQVIMKRSVDGGLTWTTSTVPGMSVLGGQPVVQPNGTVVMPIENVGTGALSSLVSTNGGASYSGPFTIAVPQDHFNGNANFRDGEGLPSAEVDGAGKVFVGWSDCRFRPSCKANDIVFSTSTDGQTWTSPARVPIGAPSGNLDLYLPGLGVDKNTSGATARIGLVAYAFNSPTCNPNTCQLNAVFIGSRDGGATWSRARVMFGPINLNALPLTSQGFMVGDYSSTSFNSAGRAFPVLANATGSTCTLGQITSCNEFMVTPTGGLLAHGPFSPATRGPVYRGGERTARPGATAF
jgi:hypothetical protein